MTHIVRLQAHDPLPTGQGDYVTVVHRFKDDAPGGTVTEITIHSRGAGARKAVAEDQGGHALGFDRALERALLLAEQDGIAEVFAVDRTAGPHERTVAAHHGERDGGDTDPGYDEAAHAGTEEGGPAHTPPEDARNPEEGLRR